MKKAIVVLFLVALLRIALALSVPVSSDEAYYWDCSRHIDFSYFDQPPLVIWSLGPIQTVLGVNGASIRAPSIIASFFIGFLLLKLSELMTGHVRMGLVLYLVLQVTPLFFIGSFYLSTDIALAVFWLYALYAVLRVQTGNPAYWIHLGLALGLGFLSKFPMVLFLPVLFFLPWKYWKWKYVIAALFLAAALSSPVWIWARIHQFDNMVFQLSGRHHPDALTIKYLSEFVLSQWILLGPVFPSLFVLVLWKRIREWVKQAETRIILMSGLSCFVFFGLVSLRERVGAHWGTPGIIPLALLLAATFVPDTKQIRWGMISSGLLTLIFLVIAWFPSQVMQLDLFSEKKLSYFFGYRLLTDKIMEIPGVDLWVTDAYALAALSGYYSHGKVQATLIHSSGGEHGLSYLYWQENESFIGKNALFFSDRPEIEEYVRNICREQSALQAIPVLVKGKIVRFFYLVQGRFIENDLPFRPPDRHGV